MRLDYKWILVLKRSMAWWVLFTIIRGPAHASKQYSPQDKYTRKGSNTQTFYPTHKYLCTHIVIMSQLISAWNLSKAQVMGLLSHKRVLLH